MPSSKPKNGNTSSQDYVNLIYTDSDSDTVPDLNLPPLKGKKTKVKTKTRRNPTLQHQPVSVTVKNACSACTVVRVILGTVISGAILALAVTSYWLMQQITELKDQINTLENKNAGTPEEFQALQSRLNLIDKSLNDIRTGKHGLQSLNESIVSMQAQIASLAATQQQQQQSIQTSSSNNNNHEDVAKTVADLGSGLHSAQSDINTLKESQKTFTSQLGQITAKVTVLENHSGREGGSSQSDTEGLQAMVTQLNTTFSQSIAKAVTDLSRQQTHIEALDQFTQELQTKVSGVQRLALTLNASQHIMQEALLPQNTTPSSELQKKVDDLELTLEQGLLLLHHLQTGEGNLTKSESSTNLSSPPPSDHLFETLLKEHQEFVHFKTEVYHDISNLNASVALVNGTIDSLRKDVGEVSSQFGVVVHNMTSISGVVDNLATLVHSHHPSADHGADSNSANSNSQATHNAAGGGTSTRKPAETPESTSQSSQPAQNSNSDKNPRSAS